MRFAISLVLLAAVLSAPSAACGVPQLAQNVQVPKTFVYEEAGPFQAWQRRPSMKPIKTKTEVP